MADTVDLSIQSVASQDVLLPSQTLRLPVEVGRFGADNTGRVSAGDGQIVQFGAGFGTLSRQHMTVTQAPDGALVVTDLSSNGVVQISQTGAVSLGRGGTVRMAPGAMGVFETVGLRVTVTAPKVAQVTTIGQPLHLVYDSASTGRLKALDLDGVSIALVAEGAEVLMRRRPGIARAALQTLRSEGARCLVMVGPDGAGGIVAIGGAGGEVSHNRRMLEVDEAVPMDHLDTVDIRGQLLRIMSAEDGKGLSCTNPACRQLNPYLPGENCRYCGQRLGDGTSYWVHS
ncbi:hypothetical protein [Jannaschia sp. CCS1]|uniref:hypothetical protein n=1 Tax=Jannaschia sp. (strain CCS1) TaxID=290400 RepID=UPI000053A58F|nr:hypothetical protein [Jannaschia sp. CCS1]ABD54524.1 hypothetical protein Jann_1607 [Jannaschia sp. CCS1]